MPLVSGKKARTESGFKTNLEREISAGKPKKQALAIAYSKANESKDTDWQEGRLPVKDAESARKYDLNDFMEVKGTNISKVGVYPYSGAQIGSPELEPDKIYMVYRPEEELSHPQAIESFKLIPFTDEHAMLGTVDGTIPAEQKGVHGVVGEDVYFEYPYLKANVKVFSNKLKDLIDNGKKELSIGYRCLYEYNPGVYTDNNKNEPYDFVQRELRGNHLALVEEGRSGSDVAVLDHFKFVFDTNNMKLINPDLPKPDSMGAKEMAKEDGKEMYEEDEMSLEECGKMIKDLAMKVEKMMKGEKESGDEEPGVKEELSEKAAKEGDSKDEDPADFVNRADIEDNDDNLSEAESKEKERDRFEMDKAKDEEGDMEKKDGDYSKPADKGSMDSQLKALRREVMDMKKVRTKVLLQEISKRDSLAQKLSHHIGTFDHAEKTLTE